MFRVIFYLLLTVIVITVLRSVIGVLMRALAIFLGPQPKPKSKRPPLDQVPLSGELKKDPSCGTYIAAATSIQERFGGETFYFCSKDCRDKYVASLSH